MFKEAETGVKREEMKEYEAMNMRIGLHVVLIMFLLGMTSSLMAAEGDTLWQTGNIGESLEAMPAVDDSGNVYIQTIDGVKSYTSGGSLRWSTTSVSSNDSAYVSISPDNSMVYGGGSGGAFALNATNGNVIWTNPVDNFFSVPCVSKDGTRLYFGSGDINFTTGTIYALNTSNGNVIWSRNLSGGLMGGASLDDSGTIYITSQGINSQNGILYSITDNGSSSTENWTFNLGLESRLPVAIGSDGSIYASSNTGVIHKINPANGNEIWNTTCPGGCGEVFAALALSGDGNTIYVNGEDSQLHAFDTSNGNQKWEIGFQGWGSDPLVRDDGVIIVMSQLSGAGRVAAIQDNGTSATILWTSDQILSNLTLNESNVNIGSNGTIYVHSGDQSPLALFAIEGNGQGLSSSSAWPKIMGNIQNNGNSGGGTPPETDPPAPNPSTWASVPSAQSSSSIAMTATTASDPSGPVEYQFDETTGNSGGTDSGWQTSTSYTDTGLSASTQYCYRVRSRDNLGNTGNYSTTQCATTDAGGGGGDVTLLSSWVTGTTHADPAGANRALIFTAHAEDNDTAMNASVTYGGQVMTKIIEQNQGTGYRAYVATFILDDAGIAAATNSSFNVTWGQTPSRTPGFASLFLANVDQANLTGASSGNGSNSNTVSSAALSTNNGDLVIVAGTCGNTGSYTVNNGFTEGTEVTVTSGDGVAGQKQATGANETPSITHSNANRQVVVGFVVNADGGGGGDTAPPTPNPSTFASAPAAGGTNSISMTATTASDPSTPIEYQFDETSGNSGGTDSGWQTSASYTDTGLSASTQYCYRVRSRDALANTGTYSSTQCATTDSSPDTTPPTPNPSTWASLPTADGSDSISMTATTASDSSTPVEYEFDETTGGQGATDSGWQASSSYTDLGLTESTQYTYRTRSRDSVGNTGSYSTSESATTDVGSGCTVIISDDFEGGSFGSSNWNDGGTDCLFHSGGNSPQGTYSINLQDNSTPPASTTFSDVLDLSAYADVKVSFTYQTISFDSSNEDFFLEVSTNGGSSYTTIEEWNLNDEFVNGVIDNDEATSSGIPLTNNTRVRFRCDATANGDDLYLDEIIVSGCGTGSGGGGSWQSLVNDNDASISYSGGWQSVPATNAYQTDAHFTDGVGNTANFSFTGTGLRVFVWQLDVTQTIEVSIDGQDQNPPQVPSGPEGSYQVLEVTGLSSGSHNVVITSEQGEVHLDAYQVFN